jgi:hypothetical protein
MAYMKISHLALASVLQLLFCIAFADAYYVTIT